jgi:hypothetical protein
MMMEWFCWFGADTGLSQATLLGYAVAPFLGGKYVLDIIHANSIR